MKNCFLVVTSESHMFKEIFTRKIIEQILEEGAWPPIYFFGRENAGSVTSMTTNMKDELVIYFRFDEKLVPEFANGLLMANPYFTVLESHTEDRHTVTDRIALTRLEIGLYPLDFIPVHEAGDISAISSMEEDAKFDALIRAMQIGDVDYISALANDLFIDSSGRPNFVVMSVFSRYAPCEFRPGESDSFGWLTGVIKYNDKEYVFG